MPHDPVIEPTALPSLGSFRLDVREPAAFEADHPAKAVRVPIEVWETAAKAGETSFENVAYWQHAIADLGVDSQLPTVVYDDGRMTEAARVWFILQYFGAEAFILNGGWAAIHGRRLMAATALASETAFGPYGLNGVAMPASSRVKMNAQPIPSAGRHQILPP